MNLIVSESETELRVCRVGMAMASPIWQVKLTILAFLGVALASSISPAA